MAKLWDNSFHNEIDKTAEDFNSSIEVDSKMILEDILGSKAHAKMLYKCGIISEKEFNLINENLDLIKDDFVSQKLEIDFSCEDIHEFIENELTKRIGEIGGKLHTARSRNDQVTTDLRLFLRKETDNIISLIKELVLLLCDISTKNTETIMPGYTHLRRAQPISFAFYLMAYASMFTRDIDRLLDTKKRINILPLGSCALAGTTFQTDRTYLKDILEMEDITINSMDGVSDRDYVIELSSSLSIVMMHLSRFSEEIILYSSLEFGFINIGDDFTTGSSIMPQKKNPDIAELVRGKTGRVYGCLFSILTIMKGLPLAYNKDLQEDKELIFDAINTVSNSLKVMTKMLSSITADSKAMENACKKGYIEATDMADYLAKKGLPFRDAYKITGDIISYAFSNKLSLDEIKIDKYKEFSSLFEEDIYEVINLKTCISKRNSSGGTSKEQVEAQIKKIKELISSK